MMMLEGERGVFLFGLYGRYWWGYLMMMTPVGGGQDGGTTYRMAGRGRGVAGEDEVEKEGPMVVDGC